jgi:hypothetical protein
MSDLTVADVFEIAAEQVEIEHGNSDHDIPNHAETIVNTRVADLLRTVKNTEMAIENDEVEEGDSRINEALEADVVDIILALGAFSAERDLDIQPALENRIEEIENFREFEERLEEAEDDEEIVEALEETMGEDMRDNPMVQEAMETGVSIGDNVDNEDYDGEERGVY